MWWGYGTIKEKKNMEKYNLLSVLQSQLLANSREMSGGLRRSMESKAPERAVDKQITQEQIWRWGERETFAKSIRASCPFYL